MPSEEEYVTVINIKWTDYSEYESFYQKGKNGSGGFQDRNSIILFGKDLVFETTLDEFKILFDEFKPKSEVSGNINDPIHYCVTKEHPTDPFKGHSVCAAFEDYKLMKLELHGSSDENISIVKKLLTSLNLRKKE